MIFVNVFIYYSMCNLIAHFIYYLITFRYTTINEMVVDFLVVEILIVVVYTIIFAVDIIGGITK